MIEQANWKSTITYLHYKATKTAPGTASRQRPGNPAISAR